MQLRKKCRLLSTIMCLIIIVSQVHCHNIPIRGTIAAHLFLWNIVAALCHMHRFIPHSQHSHPKNQKSKTQGLFVAPPILHIILETILWVTLLTDVIMTQALLSLRSMHLPALTVIGKIGSCPHSYLISLRSLDPVHRQCLRFMSSRSCKII